MVKQYIGYIYKITNTVNNKCYIGQTIKSIQTRFKQHMSRAIKHADMKSHLGAAIRTYGEQSFKIEELFKVVAYSIETRIILLDTLECYYIRKFNSRNVNLGYNLQPGGQYPKTTSSQLYQSYLNKFKHSDKCSVPGCDNPHLAFGLCCKHYTQKLRHGQIQNRTRLSENEIVIRPDYAEIVVYDKQNNECGRGLIDLEDVDKVKQYKWHLNTGPRGVDVLSNTTVGRLSSFLISPPEGFVILHKNGNGLDSRKSNIEVVSHTEQGRRNSIQKNNKSGHKGVWFCKDRNKWQAQITINHKTKSLGRFESLEEAIQARVEAEQKYYT